MPYKTDKKKLGSPHLDKRVKLLPCQKEMILYWYNEMGLSIHGLGRMFNVSRRLIQFILFPERKERNLETRKDMGGSKAYYKKDKHTKAIREHRKRKYEILKNT